jgi:AcrR family transcriptional regulator
LIGRGDVKTARAVPVGCRYDRPAHRAHRRPGRNDHASRSRSARESGYAELSIEAVASRAGVGKHTVYRRWPSRGLLFLDAVLSLDTGGLAHRDTGDVVADLREVMTKAADLLGQPPRGPLYQDLIGEAQHDPDVAAALNQRFIEPQTADTRARLRAAKEQGQLAPDVDLDLAFDILSGALYFRLLITQQPLTHDYIDRVLHATFAGLSPRPEP